MEKNIFTQVFCCTEQNGSAPLLDNDELELANLVYNTALKEVSKREYLVQERDPNISFNERIEATKINLKKVTDLFEMSHGARKEFLKTFPPWCKQRKETNEQLKGIAKAMQTHRCNSNISKIVGGCVGVLGGAAVVGSFVCPIAAPVLLPAILSIGGGVTSGLGGATIFGTSVAEIALLKANMEKAKAVLELDRICFVKMELWFEHSKELISVLEDIVGFDVMKMMANDIKSFVDSIRNIDDSKSGGQAEKFKRVLNTCVKNMCALGLIQMNYGLEIAPVVIAFIFVVCLMCQRNRFIFDCVVLTQRLGLGFLSGFDVGLGTSRAIAGVLLKGSASAGMALPGTVARAVVLGTFAAVGVALDFANVVMSSIDLHKGSISKQGLDVAKAADKLEEEFAFFNKVYNELNVC